jgi:hypothetical protein
MPIGMRDYRREMIAQRTAGAHASKSVPHLRSAAEPARLYAEERRAD